jgi:hypothetical protein
VPTSSGIGFFIETTSGPPWTVKDHDVPAASRYLSTKPRGPPLTA